MQMYLSILAKISMSILSDIVSNQIIEKRTKNWIESAHLLLNVNLY